MQTKLHVVGMPPSSYRPSPPSARPMPVTERAAPTELSPPPVETEPVAAKKKRGKEKWARSPESIAKQKATLAARKAANGKPEKTLVSQRGGKPPKNPVEIQVTGVQAWLRAELEALKPELRRLVREELRAMLGGS